VIGVAAGAVLQISLRAYRERRGNGGPNRGQVLSLPSPEFHERIISPGAGPRQAETWRLRRDRVFDECNLQLVILFTTSGTNHQAATTCAPPTASWSTRPRPRLRSSALNMAMEGHHRARLVSRKACRPYPHAGGGIRRNNARRSRSRCVCIPDARGNGHCRSGNNAEAFRSGHGLNAD
jgi:hypothetical protein